MSDISLRFDGLVLAGVLALMAIIYLVIALGLGLAAQVADGKRGDLARKGWRAAAFAIAAVAGSVLAFAYMDQSNMAATGPDWIDWLTLPALALFVAGCVNLAWRRR
jgi:hypothetical protein